MQCFCELKEKVLGFVVRHRLTSLACFSDFGRCEEMRYCRGFYIFWVMYIRHSATTRVGSYLRPMANDFYMALCELTLGR